MANILNIISATSPNGGTITKLRVLMTKSSAHTHFLYHPGFSFNIDEIKENLEWCEKNKIVAYYGIHNRNIFANAIHVTKIIKRHKIEIVHFYFNHEQSFAGLVRIFNPQVKMVRSIVGFDHRLPFLRRLLLNITFHFVPNYIYISNYIKELYETDYPVLKKKNTEIIYNGPVNVRSIATNIRKRKKIVSTGALCNRKNSMVLINAFDIIENQYKRKDIYLYLIGDGDERNICEDKIKGSKLENVVLVGYTNKVADYLDDCAVYVHPAITEGFGIAVVEAMQMGCPCVVADKGALPELVVNGENGYVVDAYNPKLWAEKIIELFDNLELREKMGNNSFVRARERFSLEAFVNNHEEYYSRLMTGK